MSNEQSGIKPSKKYANGTIHENASGRFQILDRFLGKDGVIYLKFQWIATGQVETNKEVNVSASIWKFEKAHGKIKPVEEKEPLPAVTPADTLEKLEELADFLHEAHSDREEWQEHMDKIHVGISSMAEQIISLIETKTETRDHVFKLEKQVDELQDKLATGRELIKKLTVIAEQNTEQIAMLIKQNDIASKLIEKM